MKDPRFNFYPDNWEGGTEDFTLEQEGAYLRLINMQSRRGRFTKEQAIACLMRRTFGNAAASAGLWEVIKEKLSTDGSLFWSERLELEVNKSKTHSALQKERADKRWKDKNNLSKNATASPTAMPVGIGTGSNTEFKNKIESQPQDAGLPGRLELALDEQTLELKRIQYAHRGLDFGQVVAEFRAKVLGAPEEYAEHSIGGLRMALDYQIRNTKTQKNGNNTSKKDQQLTSLVTGYAQRHGK